MKKLFLGASFALCSGLAAAEFIPLPNNTPVVEYKKVNNTYTYEPVTQTGPGKGVVFGSNQGVSDVSPKVVTQGQLPYQHAGGDAKVTATSKINPARLGAGTVAAAGAATAAVVAGTINPVAGLACAVFCYPLAQLLVDYGISKIGKDDSGNLVLLGSDTDYGAVSTTREYIVFDSQATSGWQSSSVGACKAFVAGKNSGGGNRTFAYRSVSSACYFDVYENGKLLYSNTPQSMSDRAKTCQPGYFMRDGVCGEGQPMKKMGASDLDQMAQNAASDARWSPAMASLAAALIAAGYDLVVDGSDITVLGPDGVPLRETVTESPVDLVPGTNTPVPPGHTGPTDKGTQTTTKTETAKNSFDGNKMTTSTVTNTTTNITNNITNVTTSKTETSEKDETPPEAATDTPLADIPELYKKKYPAGIIGVWNSKKSEFSQTSFFALINQLTPKIGQAGTCPSWSIDLSWTPGGSMGVHEFQPPCMIWPVLKVLVIIGALWLARALIFGG